LKKKELLARIKDSEDEFFQPLVDFIRGMVEPEGKYSPANCLRRFRTLVLVHSFLYYRCGESVVSDGEWDRSARVVKILQESFPEVCALDFFDEDFKDWTGMTGFDLTYNEYIVEEAKRTYFLYRQITLEIPDGV